MANIVSNAEILLRILRAAIFIVSFSGDILQSLLTNCLQHSILSRLFQKATW